ncbi:hypothetical protein XELAEV_18041841mg [Xenopus laevis]|uniref:Uncharacterized protein n=1 Tax=Xenopus laevis TaxID=8355 RepID=A0A974C2Z0_XENLA|nr:hypothetical protein XELAEV_18041841mg [Xenopus laevis]
MNLLNRNLLTLKKFIIVSDQRTQFTSQWLLLTIIFFLVESEGNRSTSIFTLGKGLCAQLSEALVDENDCDYLKPIL